MFADVFNTPIHLLELNAEASAWGAAVVGGIAVGLYPDWNIANAHSQITRVVKPNREHAAQYQALAARFEKMYRALEPLMR